MKPESAFTSVSRTHFKSEEQRGRRGLTFKRVIALANMETSFQRNF